MPQSSLFLKQVEVGLMKNFNYLVGDAGTRECVYIDPAWEVDRLLKLAKTEGYRVTKILLTHNHFDHTEGVEEVVTRTGAEILVHPLDDKLIRLGKGRVVSVIHGSEVRIGGIKATAIHTPGHTPGSTCFLFEAPNEPFGHLFSGDTLFQGNCGRCDLAGGDPRALFKSLNELKQLDPSTRVYPGHDYGTKPMTTISYEKQHNPAMKVKSFEEFNRFP